MNIQKLKQTPSPADLDKGACATLQSTGKTQKGDRMKRQTVNRIAIPLVFALSVATVLPIKAQQAPVVTKGGRAKAQVALTQANKVELDTLGDWVSLPGAHHWQWVDADTADTFSVTFSAECTKDGGGSLRLRILDNGEPLEPRSGISHVFCQSPSGATHMGKWVRKTKSSGWHLLEVETYLTSGTAVIDDWTFEVVVYE